jgi:hypothetical protein
MPHDTWRRGGAKTHRTVYLLTKAQPELYVFVRLGTKTTRFAIEATHRYKGCELSVLAVPAVWRGSSFKADGFCVWSGPIRRRHREKSQPYFVDPSILKEIEDSRFVKELYGN